MKMVKIVLFFYMAISTLGYSTMLAEQQATAVKPKPCISTNHRAFDFWLGEWEVTTPSRKGWKAHNSIKLSNDGCSINEHYITAGGYQGQSINFYDSKNQHWHQTWIDNQGGALYLSGNFIDGAMVMSDKTNRITWTLLSDKRVRQHWQTTADSGKTWTTAFDGYYQLQNQKL